MEYKTLNKTGEKISVLGIGTWKMGENPEQEEKAIRTALDNGMRFIDTAEMYGSEWIVGNAIKKEKEIFLATKVSPNHFRHDELINSCNASLKSLGVKQIDLYQLHWPNHSVPIAETMHAMEELVDEGKIRHIGVSNFDVKELQAAQESMKKYEIVSNQVEYSILVRDIVNDGTLDYCAKNKITIIAYSPLARGAIFTPKYSSMLEKLEQIGRLHKKSPTQVALNWLISQKEVVAIPKASDSSHVLENAGASGWKLSQKETDEINSASERKGSLAGVFSPVIKRSGIWAGAASVFNKRKDHSKRKTTKSSKK